ncbi:unnamed protein product [Effrenium voratum]|nr:unnamed protein product [Effrenium voratum]
MAHVLRALELNGCCILEDCGTSQEAAAALPARIFGAPGLLGSPAPAEVSEQVLAARGIAKDDNFRAHTDGHAYGDKFPDYFLLLCSVASDVGGGNFLIDGYALLEDLASEPDTAWVPPALAERSVNQTSRLPSVTPVLVFGPGGRRALRCRLPGPPMAFAAQRVSEASETPDEDAKMLAIYHEAIQKAADRAERVFLRPGDALVVDNYRMFHGRDPYTDPRRLLWRCWIWTTASRGLPEVPENELQSTPGNAAGIVQPDEGPSKSDQYFKFGRTQMEGAMENLKSVSGSELLTKIRENGFRLTVGDITFVLAESYGFCWGVERAVAMAYEARDFFPEKNIWVTNEIIHNPSVNQQLSDKNMRFVETKTDGSKDYSGVEEGDVVILPAFGASIDEMALLKERNVQIVDTTCPWVSKVWGTVEKSKEKGHTAIIHGKYDHEETVATKSFAQKYLVLKNMKEAEYVADYLLGNGKKEEFMAKFEKAMSPGFDPDVDLNKLGVANQTTMLKGETELIGKLFERTLIKKFGPQEINEHFMSFNTICDATQERQDAMYKMFGAEYEAPESSLYAELEGEQARESSPPSACDADTMGGLAKLGSQVGISLLSTKEQEKLEPTPKFLGWQGQELITLMAPRNAVMLRRHRSQSGIEHYG